MKLWKIIKVGICHVMNNAGKYPTYKDGIEKACMVRDNNAAPLFWHILPSLDT